jgi:hypothetical protein
MWMQLFVTETLWHWSAHEWPEMGERNMNATTKKRADTGLTMIRSRTHK